MNKDLLLGLDIGTTGCKAVLTDNDLNILGSDYHEYPLITPCPGYVEQDPELWWQLSVKAIVGAIRQSGKPSGRIAAISVSSQGIAFVPVDKNCRPLRNAISWLDTRAEKETKEVLDVFSSGELYRVTGKRASSFYTLPKILWMMRNEPRIYDAAYKLLMPHDYIIAKLSREFVTDRTMASGTMMYDIRKNCWACQITDRFGIEKTKLPEVVKSGTIAGYVTEEASAITGIPEDTSVICGGQDQKCAALGAGINDRIITVSLGTATAIERICDQSAADGEPDIPVFSYLFGERLVMEGVVGASGLSLKWFRDTIRPGTEYSVIDAEINESTDIGKSLFFYPFLAGAGSPFWYDNAKGCFYGLDLSTGSADMARSVLEAVCFQIKSNIEAMNHKSIFPAEKIRIFGGGARGQLWPQFISDITGYEAETLSTHETASIGACMLAGTGSGIFSSFEEATAKIRVSGKHTPDPRRHEIFSNKYNEYLKIQNRIMRREFCYE